MQAKGREKDEELALFFEMRRREKENEGNNNLLISEDLDDLPLDSSNNECSSIGKSVSYLPLQRKSRDEFLNSENDKSDYDWLLTPPGTPLVSLEMESQKTALSQPDIPVSRPIALRSRPANIQVEPASKRNIASKCPSLPELNASNTGSRRPVSAEGPKTATRRSATPTARPTLPSTTKPARSSTPSSRPSIVSMKSVAPPARSSTPTRSSARSSTPTGRASLPAAKSAPRSATPTHQNPPSKPSGRASSTSKLRPTSSKNAVFSRGPSPTVKSRPGKPSETTVSSVETPSNLKNPVPARPASASRARPAGPSIVKSMSTMTGSSVNTRQNSCSPARGRPPHSGFTQIGNLNRSISRSRCNDNDEVSPVVMGTMMVERVVNMRKLAPPKREDDNANGNSAGKACSVDSLGFGRTLSKKSLDMAIRHMDIRRTVQGGSLRQPATSVPASSVYSIRTGTHKNTTASNSDSPHATSSSVDSEPSVDNAFVCLDGSDIEGIVREQQIYSSVIEQGR